MGDLRPGASLTVCCAVRKKFDATSQILKDQVSSRSRAPVLNNEFFLPPQRQEPRPQSGLSGPEGECRAVLDVGSNSVKILVAYVSGQTVVPLLEQGRQTRLGAGSFTHQNLQPDAIHRTALAVRELLTLAQSHHPQRIRAIATAAAREASNRDDLRRALLAEGVQLEILTGDQEADLAFRGVFTDPRLAGRTLLVTDVGGGSTEFVVGSASHRHFHQSFPIGAVRLFEALRPPEPPTTEALAACRDAVDSFLTTQVAPLVRHRLRLEPPSHIDYLAAGGTAVLLARLSLRQNTFDRQVIEDLTLSADDLHGLTEQLWNLPLPQRRALPGMLPERADIMLTGSALHEGILRVLGLNVLRPTTRGLRYAALLDAAA